MISLGPELEVMEMMGVMGSNCRMREVADTPSRFGMTISYTVSSVCWREEEERSGD
jgi:hypothetical protein